MKPDFVDFLKIPAIYGICPKNVCANDIKYRDNYRFFVKKSPNFKIAHFAPDCPYNQFYSGYSRFAEDEYYVYTDSMRENIISTKIFICLKNNDNYNPFRWEVEERWLQQRNRPQRRPQQRNPP